MTDLCAERVLVLAPQGRDASIAARILHEAGLNAEICPTMAELRDFLSNGAGAVVMTEEALADPRAAQIAQWSSTQPAWSDLSFIVLTRHGGGLERNSAAAHVVEKIGNVSFLERPFHPTTLVSVMQSALRSRQRQYECRRLNDDLELRVGERTAELAAANRQLLSQIEEREKMEKTLRRMQRLEAVGQLTAGVAHDFNNLLTVVLGNIPLLEKELLAAGVEGKPQQRLASMRSAAERGAKLTDQLLAFSRRQRLEPRGIDLNETLRRMHDLLHSTMGGSVNIKTRFADALWPAMADPTQLELAVLNLAINARDAMEVGGTLTVSTANVILDRPQAPEDPPPGEYVVISVADTGTGMSDEVRAKALEPFFTTKEVGKGSGLGLSQVLGFAKQSAGGIRIETQLGQGTTIQIFLPRAGATMAETAPPSEYVLSAEARNHAILLVDDDYDVRETTANILRDLGYQVLEAGSAGAALEVLDQHGGIDLAVLDYAMPGMNGLDLARQIQIKLPSLPVLFVTGFADRTMLSGVSESNIVGKPFVDDELASKVRLALHAEESNVIRLKADQR
ncbi:MAG TPA: response regulator [Terriglobales bacterium]|nr:response regulator [Terriglobales bacterium]